MTAGGVDTPSLGITHRDGYVLVPENLGEFSAQLRYPSEGRHYYQKKIAEGKTSKEAIRALKRRISDAVYRRLVADV